MKKNVKQFKLTCAIIVLFIGILSTHGGENNESVDVESFQEILTIPLESAGHTGFNMVDQSRAVTHMIIFPRKILMVH